MITGVDPGRGHRQAAQEPDPSDRREPAGDPRPTAGRTAPGRRRPVVIGLLHSTRPITRIAANGSLRPLSASRIEATTAESEPRTARRLPRRRSTRRRRRPGARSSSRGPTWGRRRTCRPSRRRASRAAPRARGPAAPPNARRQAPLDQDHRERDGSRIADERRIVELDAARPVLAQQHPEPEEHEQRRRAEPVDEARRDGAYEEHRSAMMGGSGTCSGASLGVSSSRGADTGRTAVTSRRQTRIH